MISTLVRLGCIAVLAALAAASIAGIIVLVFPSKSVQVRKFDVLASGQTQNAQASIVSQMVAVRIQQIDSILTNDLRSDAPTEQVMFESVLPRELRLAPELGNHIEVEFKAFDLDVAGVLNSILDTVHDGPTLRGVLVTKDKDVEILANYREKETDVLGPWVIRSSEGTGDAVELLAHQVVLDFHGKQTRKFGNMSADQFRLFISALKDYQTYVHQIASDKMANRLPQSNLNLIRAREGFKKLADQKVDCSRVYSYLGSVSTILNDDSSAKENFSAALALDPEDDFSKKALARTNVAQSLKPSSTEEVGNLSTLFKQAAFRMLNLDEDTRRAATTPILVAVLADGAADLPGIRLAQARSFTDPATGTNTFGTQVASIIASIAPSARIMPIRVFDERGGGDTASVIEGIAYARYSGAKIIVLPLGMASRSEILASTVKEAIEGGALVVAAAGNDSSASEYYPAAFPNVLSVAALDDHGKLATFSNYGPWIQASAPGVDVLALDSSGSTKKISGTSISCAAAAGVATLVWSANPQLGASQVQHILLETASKSPDSRVPAKQLNANAAVAKARAT